MCPLPCSDHNPSSVSTSVSPSASAQKSPGYKLSIHRECCCIDSGSSLYKFEFKAIKILEFGLVLIDKEQDQINKDKSKNSVFRK